MLSSTETLANAKNTAATEKPLINVIEEQRYLKSS